jgi:GT2 family glycosyltransferase
VLGKCLSALFNQTFQNFEVILIDNGSSDNSVSTVASLYPQIKIIQLESNLGFARANNIAVQQSIGKWLVLLNSDVFPEVGWLQALLDAARTYPERSFFASCQIQANNPEKLDGTGDQYNMGGLAWRRQESEQVETAVSEIDEVFSACGAAAMYPRQAFIEAGGFDEDYFSYYEDVDLGFRLRLLGYHCWYVPSARVLHVGSATLGRESEFAIYHTLRNMSWTFLKNMPYPYIFIYLPAHLAIYMAYSLFYAFCCCPCISLRALKDATLGLPAVLKKRKSIQSGLLVSPVEAIRMVSKPKKKRRNPLAVFFLFPALISGFIIAVRKCRRQRALQSK